MAARTDSFRANAWVSGSAAPVQEPEPEPFALELAAQGMAVRPQPSAVAAPRSGGMQVRQFPAGVLPAQGATWWWAGCHGGAGASTLAEATGCGRDSQGTWPVLASGAASSVVLVARTHDSGLRAAQAAARQWASGSLPPQIDLLGLVLVADAPGKLPRPLRDLARLVGGAVPRTFEIGWHEELRLGLQNQPELALASDFRALVAGLTTICTGEPDA